jgi:cytochrome bd-type quinol oxidase subunit 2
MTDSGSRRERARRRSRLSWLLLIPFAVPLCVPLYARTHPMIGAMPFFVWFQFVLVLLAVVAIGLVFWFRETKAHPEQ